MTIAHSHSSTESVILPSVETAVGLLEEHHLTAWTRRIADRERFGLQLAAKLRLLSDTQVCLIAGGVIHDLATFCKQLGRALMKSADLAREPHVGEHIRGRGGVNDHLRNRVGDQPGHTACKRRFYIWMDAEHLLKANAELFGELVNALTGVAAQTEYVSPDLLFIQRAVWIGGPSLSAYFENAQSPMQCWLNESEGHEEHKPFWRSVTGLARPPVERIAI